MKISRSQLSDIYALWDELNRFGADQTQEAIEHLLHRLAQMVDAQLASWFGSVRLSNQHPHDPLAGWRPVGHFALDSKPTLLALREQHTRQISQGNADHSVLLMLQQAGEFRVRRRQQLLPDDYQEHDFYHQSGIQDAIYCATPVTTDIESWVGVTRQHHRQKHFSEAESQLIELALRPLAWLQKRFILLYGIQAVSQPISRAERRVLEALLSPDSEQQIATRLCLSPSTIRTYCKRICAKLNVRGRSGLQALWLNPTFGDNIKR